MSKGGGATAAGMGALGRLVLRRFAPGAHPWVCCACLALCLVLGSAAGAAEKTLHQAVADGDVAAVKALLAQGADVNALDADGMTPLHVAAAKGQPSAAEALIAAGAELENHGRDIGGETPLHLAAQQGHADVAALLLDKGAKIEARDEQQFTPLILACFNEQPEVAKMLLDRGADVNAHNVWIWTSLHCAGQRGAVECARLLIAHGADRNVKSNMSETAMDRALDTGHLDVAALLAPDTPESLAAAQKWGPAGKLLVTQGSKDLRPLVVRVLAEGSGKPVPGAAVRFRVNHAGDQVLTDEQGVCRLPVPSGQIDYLIVSATADGFAGRSMEWRSTAEGQIPQEYVLSLKPGVAIGGTVKNERDEPVAGASVNVNVSRSGQGPYDSFSREGLKTDAAGRWRADGAPAGADQFIIHVSHPDYAESPNYHSADGAALRSMDYVSVLQSGYALTGQVLDAAGKPVAGASVLMGRDRFGSPSKPSTKTSPEGRFRFQNIAPEEQNMTVIAEGCAPALRTVKPGPETDPLTIRMEPGRTIRGRVVDPDGKPVEGANVVADTWRGVRPQLWDGRTDAEGRFAWSDAPADEVTFEVYARGYMESLDVKMTARDEEYAITIQRPLVVKGTVTDAATGKPVAAFSAVPGMLWRAQPPYWERADATHGVDGAYTLTFTMSRAGHVVRIEAEGYKSAESRTLMDDEGQVTCDFALEKGEPLAGTVLQPDGHPAEGAKCVLVEAGNGVQIENGKLSYYQGSPLVETSADGRFAFPPGAEDFVFLALHPSGYARVDAAKLPADRRVQLTAWGQVEGRVMRGDAPLPGVTVQLSPAIDDYRSGQPQVHFSSSTRTDAEGRFAFSSVPPGRARVGLEVVISSWESSTTESKAVTVEPGQTAHATIGGGGRPVVGQIVMSEGTRVGPKDVTFNFSHIRAVVPPIPYPDGYQSWPAEVRAGWLEQWLKSPEGRSYLDIQSCNYYVTIKPDGSLRAEDVPPGLYELYISVGKPGSDPARPTGESIAEISRSLTVEKGKPDEPVDLGKLECVVFANLKEGDQAPSFALETLDGDKLNLSTFHGKVILLTFWASSDARSREETANLVEVWKQFGRRADFVMLSVSLDPGKDAPRKYVQENGMDWYQGHLGDWRDTFVPDRYGVRELPGIFLIGGDGRVIQPQLHGPAIKEAVSAALGPG